MTRSHLGMLAILLILSGVLPACGSGPDDDDTADDDDDDATADDDDAMSSGVRSGGDAEPAEFDPWVGLGNLVRGKLPPWKSSRRFLSG